MRFLLLPLLITLVSVTSHAGVSKGQKFIDAQLHAIENQFNVKVGVYALDTDTGKVIAYNDSEKFAFQSTFKFIAVSALLHQDQIKPILNKTLLVNKKELLPWHPVSGKYINQPVSLKVLAEGAISYSDNTAINLIVKYVGGLRSVNKFAQHIGNKSFNLRHYEIKLNSDPKKYDDTATPKDMASSVKNILLGNILDQSRQKLLLKWMRHNTTGYHRIRAGVPRGWIVADKTGSGNYGIANDIGIAWSSAHKPIVLAIYTQKKHALSKYSDAAIAAVTRLVISTLTTKHAVS